jgi:hypothetical protein
MWGCVRDVSGVSWAPRPEGWVGERSTAVGALVFLANWLAISAFLYVIGRYLYQHGFIALHLLFLLEKARLAVAGLPPRFANIGFIYPPLTMILMLPFRDPVLAQATISGATLATVFRFLDRRVTDTTRNVIAKICLLFSPVVLYTAVENFDLLLFVVVLSAAIFYLGRHLDYDYSLYLFSAGVLYGLSFFIDFRSIYLLPYILAFACIPVAVHTTREKAACMAITLGVPILFMSCSWVFINWIFLGDPFAFIFSPASFFHVMARDPVILAAERNLPETLLRSAILLVVTLPITLPFFVGLALLRSGRSYYTLPSIALYCAPIAFYGIAIFLGTFSGTTAALSFFIMMLVSELPRMKPSWLLPVTMLVSLACSYTPPYFSSLQLPSITEYRDIADTLRGTSGSILADDGVFYPVVALSDDPARFILPYQFEFPTALGNPRLAAQYVITTRERRADIVSSVHAGAASGVLPGFAVLRTTEHYLVYERTGATPARVPVQTPTQWPRVNGQLPDRRITLSELGITKLQTSGSTRIAVDIPVRLNRLGGVPRGLQMHLNYAEVASVPNHMAPLVFEVNRTVIAAHMPRRSGASEPWTIFVPSQLLETSNELRVLAPSAAALTVSNQSFLTWSGIDHPSDISTFLGGASGRIGIIVGDPSLLPQAHQLADLPAQFGATISALDVVPYNGTLPPNLDYAIFVVQPDQLDWLSTPIDLTAPFFRIQNPLTNATLLATRAPNWLGVLETTRVGSTAILVLSYWGDASVLYDLSRYRSDDFEHQVGNVSVFSDDMTTYNVGKTLRVVYTRLDPLQAWWLGVRLPISIAALFFSLGVLLYAVRWTR